MGTKRSCGNGSDRERIAGIRGLSERFLGTIGGEPVYFLSLGASPNAIAVVIDSEGVEETVGRTHAEFFGDGSPR